MRAIVFGQSGLGKSDYLDAVSGVARTRGRTLKCISLGRRMHEIDPHKQPADKYPSLPVSHRVLLRQQAMQSILSEVERQPNNDYLIIAHAVFRLDTGSAPAYDLELFKQFRPDTVVVLIDDFHHVHRNLQGTEYRGLSLHEVLEWRDAEITSAKAIAENLLLRTSGNEGGTSWPFYVLPRGHDPEVMYRLLYEAQDRLKVYCSFPITSATEQQKKDVNNFKAELTQKHIAFDPLKIGERSVVTYADAVLEEIAERARADEAVSTEYAQLVAALKNCAGSVEGVTFRELFRPEEVLPGLTQLRFSPNTARSDAGDEPYSFALDELQHVRGTVDGQIISRDYLLIDQSDVVCAYVPWNEAHQRYDVSAGSQSELTYAMMIGRDRLVVCEGRSRKASPWITQIATKVFNDLGGLLNELETRAPNRQAQNEDVIKRGVEGDASEGAC